MNPRRNARNKRYAGTLFIVKSSKEASSVSDDRAALER